MKKHNKPPFPIDKDVKLPVTEEVTKEVQREKAEVKEVAGRHQNDGALQHRANQSS